MIIRKMLLSDLFLIEDMEKRCFSVPWSAESFRQGLMNEHQSFIVAEEDGVIVGYGGIMHIIDEGEILNIAVDEPFRRRGYGAGLLKELIVTGMKHGAEIFTLEVREGNKAAFSLYTDFGFYEVGRRKNYYSEPKEDAIIMEMKVDLPEY